MSLDAILSQIVNKLDDMASKIDTIESNYDLILRDIELVAGEQGRESST